MNLQELANKTKDSYRKYNQSYASDFNYIDLISRIKKIGSNYFFDTRKPKYYEENSDLSKNPKIVLAVKKNLWKRLEIVFDSRDCFKEYLELTYNHDTNVYCNDIFVGETFAMKNSSDDKLDFNLNDHKVYMSYTYDKLRNDTSFCNNKILDPEIFIKACQNCENEKVLHDIELLKSLYMKEELKIIEAKRYKTGIIHTLWDYYKKDVQIFKYFVDELNYIKTKSEELPDTVNIVIKEKDAYYRQFFVYNPSLGYIVVPPFLSNHRAEIENINGLNGLRTVSKKEDLIKLYSNYIKTMMTEEFIDERKILVSFLTGNFYQKSLVMNMNRLVPNNGTYTLTNNVTKQEKEASIYIAYTIALKSMVPELAHYDIPDAIIKEFMETIKNPQPENNLGM